MFEKNGGPYPSRVTGFGHPFHGLVKNGELELPNSQVIPYKQPVGSGLRYWGDTYLLAVPGVPPVSRTPLQQALDTANGWEWRNTAILSGQHLQLYGVDLNGWIYIDPAGERWHVGSADGFDDNVDMHAAYNTTVTLSKFGHIGGASEAHPYAVSLADMQQTTPPITISGGDQFGSMKIVSLTPTGDKAIIALADVTAGMMQYRPWGYLLLTITGTGDAATIELSVLRSRAQTVGAYAEQYITNTLVWGAFWNQLSSTSQDIPGCGLRTVQTVTTPTWSGWLPSNDPSQLPQTDTTPTWVSGFDASGIENSQTVTGRILAMWFNGTQIEQVKLDVSLVNTVTGGGLPAANIGGNLTVDREWTSCSDSIVTSTSDSRVIQFSRTWSWSEVLTYTFTGPGGSVTETATSQGTRMDSRDWLAGEVSKSGTDNVDLFGHPAADSGGETRPISTAEPYNDDHWTTAGGGWLGIDATDQRYGMTVDSLMLSAVFDNYLIALDAARYSNNVIGLCKTEWPDWTIAPPGSFTDPYSNQAREHSHLFRPGGVDTAMTQHPDQYVYGSWNPVTSQLARGHDQPVGWV